MKDKDVLRAVKFEINKDARLLRPSTGLIVWKKRV